MTADDELRARLQRLDPVHPDTTLDPSPSLRARQLLESAMTDTLQSAEPTAPRRSRLPILAAAAAAVAALSIGAVVLANGDSPAAKPKPKSTLALQMPAPAGGPVMNSCIRFDVSILKDMSTAFAGTVSSTGNGSVTLDVDHWYTGGSADVVTLSQPDASAPVSLEGNVTFEQGKRYLVTATDGTVNGCGYTAEATPDLESSFAEAFPG